VNKGTLTYTEGNVLEPIGDGIKVIPHICNNINKWGSGFTYSLSKKWEEPEKEYREYMSYCSGDPKDKLGHLAHYLSSAHFIQVENDIYIANMIAQSGIISKNNPKPIKYVALVKCMEKVVEIIKTFYQQDKISIHCPKFGSKLAGGNFSFILELINEIWINNDINVTIYDFK
jgi:hypothetical protein